MSTILASKIKFKDLCNALEEISKARVAKKADILKNFIQKCRFLTDKLKTDYPDMDVSLFPILRLILPSLDREREALKLKEKSLARCYIRVFCLGKSSKDANNLLQYKVPIKRIVGRDFAEKAYQILQNRLPRESSDFTIERINLFLDDISKGSSQQQNEMFNVLLGKTNALEFKWLTRIILKDIKLGIGTKKILGVIHPDANKQLISDLRQVCDTLINPQIRYSFEIKLFSHFKPMLLEQLQIENIEKLFGHGEQYFVQSKYDGERSQMHMKDGRYKYFTRNGFDITNNPGYGETSSSGFMSSVFGRLLNPNCKSVILDGELMGWHKQKKLLGSKGMNFDVKKLSENTHHRPCFVAFDIILHNDVLLINEPYEERLRILKEVFKEEEGCLILCKSTKISKSEKVCNAFNTSMKNKEEGIVLKTCDCTYKPNVRDGSGCYKIKAEYSPDLVQEVDLIILGGYYGVGKFMGLMKSFLMGVASPPKISGQNPSKFLSVVSVSNGFSMKQLKDLNKTFEGKWQTKCPPNVRPPKRDAPNFWIHPEDSIILSIRASEMSRSNDYPTGYSLRFPRVTSIRSDKPWYSVCTTTELLSLVKDTGPIQKLTKREVDYADIEEAPKQKVRKITKPHLVMPKEILTRPNLVDNNNSTVPLTRLFDGKDVCVINGDNELSKERIKQILWQHRAKVFDNPSEGNYCVLVGNPKTARASNIIERQEYDVVTLDWFKRATKEENWSSLQDILPWDFISCREATKQQLAQYYDEFYDHFYVDADEESLKRSFKKAEETANTIELDLARMKAMDEELFDDEVSPHSVFRGINGFFDDESDWSKFEFRFMAGTIKETLDDTVTHVFINGHSIVSELRNLIKEKSPKPVKILKSEWIGECFRQNEIVTETEYLVE